MTSYFDAYYGAAAAPHLMSHMATGESLTVISGESTILERADAILLPSDTEDEFTDGDEIKVYKQTVDVLVDESLSHGGLADAFTNASVILYDSPEDDTGVAWSVARVGLLSGTWQRIELVRKDPRGMTRSSYYTSET